MILSNFRPKKQTFQSFRIFRNFRNFRNAIRVLTYDNAMQRLEDKAFRTLSSSASASKRLLERSPRKLKAGQAKNCKSVHAIFFVGQ